MAASKYKVGDKVVIVGNVSGHSFSLGDEVVIISHNGHNYTAKKEDTNKTWYVLDEDLEASKAPDGTEDSTLTAQTADEYTVKVYRNGKTSYEQSFPELDVAKLVIGLNSPFQAQVGRTRMIDAQVKKPTARTSQR